MDKCVDGDTALHWERGYRSHGYWENNTRVGRVSIGPRCCWDGLYRWQVGEIHNGTAITMTKAKKIVEQIYRKMNVGTKP